MAKILLIDDSRLARNVLRSRLEKEGYTICGEAPNGREGVEKYKQLKPDLVFCDIMMNEMNGVECTKAIMSVDPDARIIICTSMGDELHYSEAIKAGAKGFIKKPLADDEVIQLAKKLIGEPVSGAKLSYKKLMEERAQAKGISGKPLLDFFDAFRQINGFELDDPKVNMQYLKENTARVTVAVRALLSAKLPTAQTEHLMNVFEGLVL